MRRKVKYKKKRIKWLRLALYLAQNGLCFWCHQPMIFNTRKKNIKLTLKHPDRCTVDHIIPLSKGGEWNLSNLVASCKWCNNKRGNKDIVVENYTADEAIKFYNVILSSRLLEWYRQRSGEL